VGENEKEKEERNARDRLNGTAHAHASDFIFLRTINTRHNYEVIRCTSRDYEAHPSRIFVKTVLIKMKPRKEASPYEI
jgi:hypothetical protein